MRHRLLRSTALALLLAALPGCLYARFKTPLDCDLDATELGTKTGRSSWQGILWAVALGDGGVQAAAADGGISVIRHADEEILSVLFGLYFRRTTIVYGD